MLAALIVAFVAGFSTPVKCVPDTDQFSGWAKPDGSVQLVQPVCDLLGHPEQKRFAYAIYTTVHEAEHVYGVMDEHDADCAALADLDSVLRRFWPRRTLAWRVGVEGRARRIHQRRPTPYYGACR